MRENVVITAGEWSPTTGKRIVFKKRAHDLRAASTSEKGEKGWGRAMREEKKRPS